MSHAQPVNHTDWQFHSVVVSVGVTNWQTIMCLWTMCLACYKNLRSTAQTQSLSQRPVSSDTVSEICRLRESDTVSETCQLRYILRDLSAQIEPQRSDGSDSLRNLSAQIQSQRPVSSDRIWDLSGSDKVSETCRLRQSQRPVGPPSRPKDVWPRWLVTTDESERGPADH